MRKLVFAAFLIALSFIVYFAKSSLSQISLPTGTTHFTITSMTYQKFQFSGDLNSLTVYWNTSYFQLSNIQQLGVKCYLNCNPLTDPQKCNGQQNCTFVGPTGVGACRIQPVQYSYPLDSQQNVACIFYDPAYPIVQYLNPDGSYPNSSFYPIDFNLYVAPNFTVTVGKPLDMNIIIQNNGVFTDNFIQTLRAYPANLISLDPRTTSASLGPLTGNSYGNAPQSITSTGKFAILSTNSPILIIIDANSTTNNTVYRERQIQITAGVSSLPDFGWLGILQIILFAAALLFFKLK